jgi:hypothetical protein
MATDLIHLATTSEIEARIWRDALAQESIPVFMRPADPLGPAGYAPMIGDVQVYVRATDERRARWIIGDRIEADAPQPPRSRARRHRGERTTAGE